MHHDGAGPGGDTARGRDNGQPDDTELLDRQVCVIVWLYVDVCVWLYVDVCVCGRESQSADKPTLHRTGIRIVTQPLLLTIECVRCLSGTYSVVVATNENL